MSEEEEKINVDISPGWYILLLLVAIAVSLLTRPEGVSIGSALAYTVVGWLLGALIGLVPFAGAVLYWSHLLPFLHSGFGFSIFAVDCVNFVVCVLNCIITSILVLAIVGAVAWALIEYYK